MSTINFLKRFSKMSVADVSQVQVQVHDETETKQNKINVVKKYKTVKDETVRFMHGKNVIMTCGQYKGYVGYVYDETACCVEIEVEMEKYVFTNGISSGIDVVGATIVGKVPILYGVLLGQTEVRLPQDYYLHVTVVNVNGMRKLGKFINMTTDECNTIKYELQILDLNYDKNKTTIELLDQVSEKIVNNMDVCKNMRTEICDTVCDNDYYIILRDQYRGKYGKLSRVIGEQNIMRYKTSVIVNKNFTKINGECVDIIRGEYRGKTAKLLRVIEPTFTIQIDAIGKKIHSHLLCLQGTYMVKPITANDIYYIDLLLNNGNYFNVTCVTNSVDSGFVYRGIERSKNGVTCQRSQITLQDVQEMMPGFKVYDQNVITKSLGEMNTVEEVEDIVNVEDDVENVVETEQSGEHDEENENTTGDYADNEQQMEENDIVYDNTEGEAKATFRDTERSGYVNSDVTDEDKKVMKRIEKCASIVGSCVSDVFQLVARVNEIVDRLKSELQKSNVLTWSEIDTKYIIAYVVLIDRIRSGYSMTIEMFNEYNESLYKNKYFTKGGINSSIFLGASDSEILHVIKMSETDKVLVKDMYKSGKYIELVMRIMSNCIRVMELWYGVIKFDILETDYIMVEKRKEYPKYFLTTRDILENKQCETATKMLWGPTTYKFMKQWLDMVASNCDREQDVFKKSIYRYVIDNFERAPFVLKTLQHSEDELDKIRYVQLQKIFTTFMKKLQVYRESKQTEREQILHTALQTKDRIMKRRSQFDTNKYEDVLQNMEDLSINKRVKVV